MSTIDSLADDIMEGLREYAELADDAMKNAVKKTATSVKKEISTNAPKDSGAYKKSWATKKVKENSHTLQMMVHSKNRYQLAHLLEKRSCQAWRRQSCWQTTYCSCRRKRCRNARKPHKGGIVVTYEEINEMMAEMGLPYAYHHFAEGESPNPPFLIFLSPGENIFSADNIRYHSFKKLDIELYTDRKNPASEEEIEAVLTRHELYFLKSETWIESEKMYEVLYEMEV